MNHRPISKSKIEKLHDLACVIVIIGMFVYTVLSILQMTDTIPIHTNAKGEANGWGSRWMCLIMPFIIVILYIFIGFLQKYPKKYNYPDRLSGNNAYAFYRHSKILVSWIKLEVVLNFAYINWCFVKDALGQPGYPVWYALIGFLIIILTVIMGLVLRSRIK
ncbi:magnesium-transporting ATPase (P-type) [Scopulibacillus daqui]|uniref:Magnesium-transporting ATPase (P-type) n=1 Tax=Scopulibacillus daqui TaxID=1469162 RepID=A0ABS2PXQ4_9BACL|nr:DUF1648 domain-containing protein [Scopulibacillus daqui]MBM7644833.1 magnesium-transporting ATPase (P-type) [Scopulibacillus daqui]